jgi:hypothetical protein
MAGNHPRCGCTAGRATGRQALQLGSESRTYTFTVRAPRWRPFYVRKRSPPRRHYNPGAHPVRLAAFGSAPLSGPDLVAVQIIELMSLDALARGKATPQDLGMLRRVVLLSAALAGDGVGPEVLPLVNIAHGRALTSPMMFEVLRELVGLHDQQRAAVSRAEYEALIYAYLADPTTG